MAERRVSVRVPLVRWRASPSSRGERNAEEEEDEGGHVDYP